MCKRGHRQPHPFIVLVGPTQGTHTEASPPALHVGSVKLGPHAKAWMGSAPSSASGIGITDTDVSYVTCRENGAWMALPWVFQKWGVEGVRAQDVNHVLTPGCKISWNFLFSVFQTIAKSRL